MILTIKSSLISYYLYLYPRIFFDINRETCAQLTGTSGQWAWLRQKVPNHLLNVWPLSPIGWPLPFNAHLSFWWAGRVHIQVISVTPRFLFKLLDSGVSWTESSARPLLDTAVSWTKAPTYSKPLLVMKFQSSQQEKSYSIYIHFKCLTNMIYVMSVYIYIHFDNWFCDSLFFPFVSLIYLLRRTIRKD